MTITSAGPDGHDCTEGLVRDPYEYEERTDDVDWSLMVENYLWGDFSNTYLVLRRRPVEELTAIPPEIEHELQQQLYLREHFGRELR